MNFAFEKATEKETKTVIELLTKLYMELGEERESIQFLSGELIRAVLKTGNTEIYLVKCNSDIAGIFTITETQAIYAGGNYGVIDEMYIEPSYREKNAGKETIDFIRGIAESKNWKRLDVTTPTEERWKRTVAFYQKNGFIFTGQKLKFPI